MRRNKGSTNIFIISISQGDATKARIMNFPCNRLECLGL